MIGNERRKNFKAVREGIKGFLLMDKLNIRKSVYVSASSDEKRNHGQIHSATS